MDEQCNANFSVTSRLKIAILFNDLSFIVLKVLLEL